VVIGEI